MRNFFILPIFTLLLVLFITGCTTQGRLTYLVFEESENYIELKTSMEELKIEGYEGSNQQQFSALKEAQGKADKMILEAEGYATERINQAEGDVAKFNAILEEYLKAPEVTSQRLYLEALGETIPKLGRKIILDDEAQQLLPFLQIDPGAKNFNTGGKAR